MSEGGWKLRESWRGSVPDLSCLITGLGGQGVTNTATHRLQEGNRKTSPSMQTQVASQAIIGTAGHLNQFLLAR